MSESTQPRLPWWEFLFPGVIFLLGSIYAWWYLGELERTPGPHPTHWTVALLYDWGGKWAVVLFVAGVGALFTGIGTWKLIRNLRERPGDSPSP
jgi:hypothetical protein